MTVVTLQDLTTGTVAGTGVFDKLMVAAKAHLEAEFLHGRIKGPEYSQVYLASLQQVMQTSVQFLATVQKIDLEAKLLQAQVDLALAQTALTEQQRLNAVQEELNLEAQECLLKSQYDVSQATVLQTKAQTDLLTQKIATEKAQTTELGVDDNSVIGKQKALYGAQTAGFARDAEQKTANMLIQTWNTRRMTDEAVQANSTNKLDDATIGKMITTVLQNIGVQNI